MNQYYISIRYYDFNVAMAGGDPLTVKIGEMAGLQYIYQTKETALSYRRQKGETTTAILPFDKLNIREMCHLYGGRIKEAKTYATCVL
jgi:hypothetical protein